MFGKSNENKTSETQKDSQNNQNNSDILKPDATKQVLVTSRTSRGEKVVVILKKVTPPVGPTRDIFNIYTFNLTGKCIMSERDAILFWKDRRKMKDMEMDVAIYDIEMEGKNMVKGHRYKLNEVKDWYEVEEVDLEESSSQKEPKK